MARPKRPYVLSSQGNNITLNTGTQAFECLCAGKETAILMGLGPDINSVKELVKAQSCILWCEHPDFIEQLDALIPGWRSGLPDHWRRIFPEELASLPAQSAVFFYRQNVHLFPEFWGPLRARVFANRLGLGQQTRMQSVLLPGDEHALLVRELAAAFTAEGFDVHCMDPVRMGAELPALLARERPALCLSVNLRGLDSTGEYFHLLRACEVPVAIWMVDNPWHLLSSLRETWWMQAHIYVTDDGFLPALQAAGAKNAFHLPLACNPEWAHTSQAGQTIQLHPLVFVGRSSFPRRRNFFSASRLPAEALQEALPLLQASGPVPDFHWWTRRLGIKHLWPGNAVRRAGLGAEECSLARRALWLKAALPHGLTVYGDAAWRDILPELADLRPPVDYYTTLPRLYAAARYSLNVTSLLLPSGLTQRHFDVWIAGGFLLTDDTPGLKIFPAALRQESALSHPGRIKEAISRFENDAALRAHIQHAWQSCLLERHTYRHRIQYLCETLAG